MVELSIEALGCVLDMYQTQSSPLQEDEQGVVEDDGGRAAFTLDIGSGAGFDEVYRFSLVQEFCNFGARSVKFRLWQIMRCDYYMAVPRRGQRWRRPGSASCPRAPSHSRYDYSRRRSRSACRLQASP